MLDRLRTTGARDVIPILPSAKPAAGPIEIACEVCKHRISFQSHAEAGRFSSTSGWTSHGLNRLRCPVCVSKLAEGKVPRTVQPSFGAEYRR
jgi:hypothetical protein